MTRAPRIDTLRNRITATRQLLTTIHDELEDLHVLAYDRKAAAAEAPPVRGGQRDWALDTHGSPHARTAYRALAEATINACAQLAEASHNAIRILRDHQPGDTPRTRRLITTDELVTALAAQARRQTNRTSYQPVPAIPQPEHAEVLRAAERVIKERDQLRDRCEKLEARLALYEPDGQERPRRRRLRRKRTA